MHDPGVGRHDAEIVKRPLTPAQQRVALLVALELELGIALERQTGAEHVDLHRVVDHQLGGDERVDLARIAADLDHRATHRGEVHDRRHAGEVLHHHARRRERDLLAPLSHRVPARERLEVLRVD